MPLNRRSRTEQDDSVRRLDSQYRELFRTTQLFHQEWVELQLGRTFASVDEAIDAYLATPRCSPHPLVLPDLIERKKAKPGTNPDPAQWYGKRPQVQRTRTSHPLIDVDVLVAAQPELAESEQGPVFSWLLAAEAGTPLPVPAGLPPTTYGDVVARSLAAAREWRADCALRTAPRTVKVSPSNLLGAADAVPLPAHDSPLVSIVMPLWNRAHTVRAAIASVQAQGFQDWELLVVDDGSTDDGPRIVEGIAHHDPRVIPVAAPHGGVCRARNAGIERARGRYLAFLDTDNTWRPDFLGIVLGELERHQWDMAHGALQAATSTKRYYRAYEGTHADLLVANHVDLNVLIARTDLVRSVGGFDETLRRAVDHDLILKLAERSPLHLVPYVGVDYVDVEDDAPRISTTERPEWLAVVSSRHLMRAQASATEPDPAVTSVVLPTPTAPADYLPWARAVAARPDRELVLVGVRLPVLRHVVASLVADLVGGRFVRLQMDRGPETTANVGLAAARGSRAVVFTATRGLAIDMSHVDALTQALDDPAVGTVVPVVLDEAGLVETAGTTFGTGTRLPAPFLQGHATADLDAIGSSRVEVPAALGPVLAGRTRELVELGGLDPLFAGHLAETELSLRVRSTYGGTTVLLPGVRIASWSRKVDSDDLDLQQRALASSVRLLDERRVPVPDGSPAAWRSAGFEVAGHDYRPLVVEPLAPLSDPVLVPVPRLVSIRAAVSEPVPRLRWVIDLPSPSGPAGRKWGDTYYGEQLGAALRARGQHVAVDGREARHRPTRDLDDVLLSVRGLDRVRPRPGLVSMLWIISHPDDVTADEAAHYDAVFAASSTWAAERSAEWGLSVQPLLQATDPSLFHPGRASFDSGEEVLFVGNARKIYRTSLRRARAAGLAVSVHGSGWGDMLGKEAVTSEFVDNDELGSMYTAAGVVLNDHWEDMRVGGFVSNRLMDAAASGARVASDRIPGVDLASIFHGLVQTYETPEELRRLVTERATRYPAGEERVAAAAAVAAEHSFDKRAATLLDEAVSRWSARRA